MKKTRPELIIVHLTSFDMSRVRLVYNSTATAFPSPVVQQHMWRLTKPRAFIYTTLNNNQKQTGLQLERVRDRLEANQGAAPTSEEWASTLNLTKDEMLRELAVADKAKKHMISANLRLVVSMARNYQHRGLEFPDLIQEGTMGLVKATEKFNPEMGFKFYTYATWWIKQSLLTGIANQVTF